MFKEALDKKLELKAKHTCDWVIYFFKTGHGLTLYLAAAIRSNSMIDPPIFIRNTSPLINWMEREKYK